MPDTHRPNEQAEIIIEDESLRGGFTQIPNALLRRPDVTAGAKITYMALLSYAWGKDRCFPGQETLANDVGAGRRSVIRYLQELQEVGLLEITRRGLGLTNVYVLKKMAVTSRSAILAHQEVPTSTHQEMPKWQLEEDTLKEDKEVINPSNIRRSNRSNNHFVDYSASQLISAKGSSSKSRNGSDSPLSVEGIDSIMARVAPQIDAIAPVKRPRGRPRKMPNVSPEIYEAVVGVMQDYTRKLGDGEHLASNITQAVNLIVASGCDFNTFYMHVIDAYKTTSQRNGLENRSGYFFTVLRDSLIPSDAVGTPRP